MPVLSRRALLLALMGGSVALTACSLPGGTPTTQRPRPSQPTQTPIPLATNTPQRVAIPAALPRATATPPGSPVSDTLLRTRRLLYVGNHAGHRGLVTCNGDGSGAGLIADGSYGAPTWSPNGERFVVAGAPPGEERLAPRAWVFAYGVAPQLLHAHRLEGLHDVACWAPDSLRLAMLATRSDARDNSMQASATFLLNAAGVTEIAIGQQTWPLGWTASGRLVLSVTEGALYENPIERPRVLWTTSVGGDDRREIVAGDYLYMGLGEEGAMVYALGAYRPYRSDSGSTVSKPTRLLLFDLRNGRALLNLAATQIAAAALPTAARQLPYWCVGAAVAPRGDQIALWLQPEPTDATGNSELGAILAVVDANGRLRWSEMVPELRHLMTPRWSPRGDALAFGTGNEPTLVRLRLVNGRRGSIETTVGEDLRWSPDGEWIAYSQGQRLMLSATTAPATAYHLAADGRSPRWRP